MDNRSNTIAGWLLGAGIVALGASILTGEMFHQERPEKMGYPIEGVGPDPDDTTAEQPIAVYLAAADAAKGEQVFKKCTACHTINPGGANGTGPNIYGIMGSGIGKHSPGFPYSPALSGKGGNWDWESMSAWLKSPKDFAPGTKMTFAGLNKPEDRANLLAYLNSQGASPLPLPAAPAAGAAAAGANPAKAAAEASDVPAGAEKAEDEPVLTEQNAGAKIGGDAATATSGRSGQDKQ
jgi:cytochrome c